MVRKNIKNKVIFLSLIVVIILLMLGVIIFFSNNKYKVYEKYEETMDMYDFSKLYNNKSPKSSEYVSDIEAIKIIIAASYNNKRNVFSLTDELTTDEMWYEYAKNLNILDESYKFNANKKVTLVEVIKYLSDSKNAILNTDINSSEKPTFSDYKKYNKKQQYSILDLVSCGILNNSTTSLDGNKKIRKGELNELIINFVEKYTLLSSDATLLKSETERPSNANDYPYLLEDVDKEIYEQPYFKEDEEYFILPKDLYKVEKDNYNKISKTCENYFNSLLNINYTTITKDNFINAIKPYVIGEIDENKVQEYINYVIANKVILSGNATVQLPIIYNDGIDLRVRIKLTFSILQSDTKEDLLYLDKDYYSKLVYKEQNTIYIDAKLGYAINSNKIYNYQNPVYNMILKDYSEGIELKER